MPVIVMLILPVAFSGALFALPLTGKNISMISLVSLIMLAGTVVNSSIILVDYINIRRREGEEQGEGQRLQEKSFHVASPFNIGNR